MILDSKNISYEAVDISVDQGAKQEMRDKVGDPKALPPQLCNDDVYCGVRTIQTTLNTTSHNKIIRNLSVFNGEKVLTSFWYGYQSLLPLVTGDWSTKRKILF